jgi:hypothetical protein
LGAADQSSVSSSGAMVLQARVVAKEASGYTAVSRMHALTGEGWYC